jgi:hypothetical protein
MKLLLQRTRTWRLIDGHWTRRYDTRGQEVRPPSPIHLNVTQPGSLKSKKFEFGHGAREGNDITSRPIFYCRRVAASGR